MFSNRKIILIIILLVTLSVTAYVLLVVIPARAARQTYEGAKEVAEDFRKAFQFTPEVKINRTVILQQQTPILELATVNQKFQHQYNWTNTWMNSKKVIKISGTMEAKAGFNLNEKFTIDIQGAEATVTLPEPKLLSIEPLGDITYEDENGYWNWVNNDDRSAALNAFTTDAREFAQTAALVNDARSQMETKITSILQAHGLAVTIRYDGTSTVIIPPAP